jgi:hypothetical protein
MSEQISIERECEPRSTGIESKPTSHHIYVDNMTIDEANKYIDSFWKNMARKVEYENERLHLLEQKRELDRKRNSPL